MRKSSFLGLLLVAASMSMTMTSCGDDEKTPEVVVDPLTEMEYYISGKVFEGATPLAGVAVAIGDNKGTTDATGVYSLKVADKKAYTVTFKKDSYLNVDAQATIDAGAANRSMVSLSVKMNKQNTPVTVTPEAPAKVEDQKKGAALDIPAGAVKTATPVTVTSYVEPASASTAAGAAGNKAVTPALSNIVISPAGISFTAPVVLAATNTTSKEVRFANVDIYSKTVATRAEGDWAKQSEAAFSEDNNRYEFNIAANTKLASHYSMRVKSTKNTEKEQIGEVNGKEFKVDNSGNMAAIKDFEIIFDAKAGWEFTTSPTDALTTAGVTGDNLTKMATTIQEAIEAEEGGVAGVYTVKHSLKTNISGNSIMYYVNKAKFSNKTYSFTVTVNGVDKTIDVKLKAYTGMNETYTNVDASQHSGGTGGK